MLYDKDRILAACEKIAEKFYERKCEMNFENAGQMKFLSEMSDRQISAREFFNRVLLDSLHRNFNLKNVLISCYDQDANFLSWTNRNGIQFNSPNHPYHDFSRIDVVSNRIHREAARDNLTYYNVIPRIYRATDIIPRDQYDDSIYASFLENAFHAHYSATLPFGTNGYIHIFCYKKKEENDFTDLELSELEKIYIFVAHAYKNFKLHEKVKIISNIQDEIICSHENAYLITDDNMHVLAHNKLAVDYLTEILGRQSMGLETMEHCSWLPFLLEDAGDVNYIQTRVIKGYIFKIYTFDQSYIHGIVDRYHWITLSKASEIPEAKPNAHAIILTPTERKVAELLCSGLTYQAIANEMVVSYDTVKNHVQNIFSKYGVKSRYQLYQCYKNK